MNRIVIASLVVLTGCLHRTSVVGKTEHVSQTRTQTVPVPEQSGIVVEASFNGSDFSGSDLSLAASNVSRCRDELVETLVGTEKYEATLPKGHWALLATGVALAGGGVASTFLGNSMVTEGTAVKLGGPEVESRYDTGRIIFPVGIAVAAVGAGLLGTDVVNMVTLGGVKERPAESEIRTTPKETRVCSSTPAAAVKLTVSDATDPKLTINTTTDATGRVTINNEELASAFRKQWAKRDVASKPELRVLADASLAGTATDDRTYGDWENKWRTKEAREESQQQERIQVLRQQGLGPPLIDLEKLAEVGGLERMPNKNPAEDAWKRVFTHPGSGTTVDIEGPEEAPTLVGLILPQSDNQIVNQHTGMVLAGYLKTLLPADKWESTFAWSIASVKATKVQERRIGRITVSVKPPALMGGPVMLVFIKAVGHAP